MDATTIEALRTFRRMAKALQNLPQIIAEAYANGSYGTRPIVEAHFTPGNDQRNGWPPLSRDYALAKARGLSRGRGGKVRELQTLATGRKVKVDRNASFQSSTGSLSGVGTAANLPQLVRTGLLRERVVSRQLHTISVSGDTATIIFGSLPDYASYLQVGTAKMPRRSPVDPNFEDVLLLEAVAKRYLDAVGGGTTKGPVERDYTIGLARITK